MASKASTSKKTTISANQRVSSKAATAKKAKLTSAPRVARMRPLVLDGDKLTRKAVIDVALHGRKVEIAASALRKVQRAAKFLEDELARGEPLYGVTTGFGSNADRLLANERLRKSTNSDLDLVEELQHQLIVSHAVCVGDPLPESIARAMLVIRLNTLLGGHSGIRGKVLKLMAALLNAGITPIVPELGSVGASGDLAPLSHLALPLLGLGDVHCQGQRMPAQQALQQQKLEAITLSCKEGLALNNGTTQMLATAVLTLDRMDAALKHADLLAALCLEAFCGRSDAFDDRAHQLRPHPGQIATAANIRNLIKGSGLVDIAYHRVPRFHPWSETAWSNSDIERTFDIRWDYVRPAERAGRESFYRQHQPFRGGKKFQPQDAYSLRCTPQVHGAVRDSYTHVCRVIDIELNAVTDNPLVFPGPPDSSRTRVLSAGNFHGMPLALALAQLKCAIPVLASIAERRLNKLLDPATNDGLPPFLIGNEDGTDSGLMIVQYTAAAIVNDLATRAHPACVYSIPTSANAEDHVSMGTNDGRHAWGMVQDLERVQAIELLCVTQALDYRLQILDAAQKLATNIGVQGVRSKIRLPSALSSTDAEALAADVKRLQTDLRKLSEVRASGTANAVLRHVRQQGISFMARDRLLSIDLELVQRIIQSRGLIRVMERVG
jgi:histidine ammonia-lyase